MHQVIGPFEEPLTEASRLERALKLSKHKIAQAKAIAITTAEADKKKKVDAAAAREEADRKAEAERKAKAEADRQAEEEAARLLAKAMAQVDPAAKSKAATDAAYSSQAKGIFIQLPGLDALTKKVDTVADASVKLVNTVNEAKNSINSTVRNTIVSYKPDMSSVTQEIRSLLNRRPRSMLNKQ